MLILTIILYIKQSPNTTFSIEINTGTAFCNFALEVFAKIDVGSVTGYNNFDRGHPVLLILTTCILSPKDLARWFLI